MITVCNGWGKAGPHPEPVVLKPEDGGEPGVSHGMCAACDLELNGPRVATDDLIYQAYLDNPFYDPRD